MTTQIALSNYMRDCLWLILWRIAHRGLLELIDHLFLNRVIRKCKHTPAQVEYIHYHHTLVHNVNIITLIGVA